MGRDNSARGYNRGGGSCCREQCRHERCRSLHSCRRQSSTSTAGAQGDANRRLEAMKLTWEQAVAWARNTPEMADLVQSCYYDDPIEAAAARFRASEEW